MLKVNKNKIDEPFQYEAADFNVYLNNIIHQWLKTLAALGFTLVPLFFILDYFTMPDALLQRFGIYRLTSTLIVIAQYFYIRHNKPGPWSYIHGYLITLNVGGTIALMTVDLGGFSSSYYAGLNLVIIGVNLLLPWKAIHSGINSIMIIFMYILLNILSNQVYENTILINNLFFLCGTSVIAVSINHVKYKLVKQEFDLMIELKIARDALWSEMEVAKRIQTALLPDQENIKGFEIAATMLPAKEVGGDYYDIIESPNGEKWVSIGDVSGHGVDSGLIMMMAQTSFISTVHNNTNKKPSQILSMVNSILRGNISRLGSDHYMTMMAINFNGSKMTFSGKHQDVIIYRSALNKTEIAPTTGTWLGIADKIEPYLDDQTVNLKDGDIVLLFTDGITETMNKEGEIYGQIRLEQALNQYADFPMGKLLNMIIQDVQNFGFEQQDDMTILVVKKRNSLVS